MPAGDLLRELREDHGFSQLDLALAIGIKQKSTISEIETGIRRLTGKLYARIVDAHLFNEYELSKLKREAKEDSIRDEFGDDEKNFELSLGPVETYMDYLIAIQEVRQDGNIKTASKLLRQQIKSLNDHLDNCKLRSDRTNFSRMLGIFITELLEIYVASLPRQSITGKTCFPLARLVEIQDALKKEEPSYYDLARVLPVSVAYIAEEDRTCALGKRLKMVNEVSTPLARSICVRDIAVSSAMAFRDGRMPYDEAVYKYQQGEEYAYKAINSGWFQENERAMIFEALSQGRNILRLPNVRDLNNEAWREYNKSLTNGTYSTDTKAKIIRTEIMSLLRDPDATTEEIIGCIKSHLPFLEKGYMRYVVQILDEMTNHPNSLVQVFGKQLYTSWQPTVYP